MTDETEDNEIPPSELPTPPHRHVHEELTLESLRMEFNRRFHRQQDDFIHQIASLEAEVEQLKSRFRQPGRLTNSLEAMLGRVTDALTIQGAALERTETKADSILEILRTKETAAVVLEAMRSQES